MEDFINIIKNEFVETADRMKRQKDIVVLNPRFEDQIDRNLTEKRSKKSLGESPGPEKRDTGVSLKYL